MRPARHKVLIVDDDPSHLEIYGLMVKEAGFEPVPALVRFTGADFPADDGVRAAILDYKLNSLKSPIELAREIRSQYPLTPIVLLSDMWHVPTDIAPYVADFVRKGNPAMLLDKVTKIRC